MDLFESPSSATLSSAAPLPSAPPPTEPAGPLTLAETSLAQALVWMGVLLLLGLFFATLRRALSATHPARVVEGAPEAKRERLQHLLGRGDALVTSARILELTAELLFAGLLLITLAQDGRLDATSIGIAMAIAVPVLYLFGEALPGAIALRSGEGLLRRTLSAFHVLQWPLGLVVAALEGLRRAILRIFGVQESSAATKRIALDLRDVIEDSDYEGELGETQRVMIENVMEFPDVDVAAVMTPRTEIDGVDVEDGIAAALKVCAEAGHSRIPVYEDSMDTIIGTISAQRLVQVVADGAVDQGDLRSLRHPPYFVPETKRVSELLAEFRREKLKMAVVLDEYGGTAGIVTVGDITAEIVGDIQDEFDEDEPQSVRRLEDGTAEVMASLHVSEFNEALDLELPEEEDYETVGGYVLATLGHFPKSGERFSVNGVDFTVVEASDRRVLKVHVQKSGQRIGA